jgi:hypothetical protein
MYSGLADPTALQRLREDLQLATYIPTLGGVELRAAPGAKRRGLFATRPFARGELILAEAPCLWQEGGAAGPLHCPSHTPDELDGLLLQLAPYYCAAGEGAAAQGSAAPPQQPLARADLAARVLQENSFGVGAVAEGSEGGAYAQGGQGRAVYAAVALANHCCLPNARASQEGGAEALGGDGAPPPRRLLEARRDIAAGEEVTISYVPVTWMRRPRRRALEATWGFACACPRCAAAQDDTIVLRAPPAAGGGGGGAGAGAGGGLQEEEEEEEGGALVEALCAPGRPRELLQRLVQHPTHALEDVRLFLTLVRLHQAFAPAPALREEARALLESAAARMPYIALEEIL